MKHKSIIWLVGLLLLLNGQSLLLARSKSPTPKKTPAVLRRTVYAQFKVKSKQIATVISGSNVVCKDAHTTALNAFWRARIDSADLEYQVMVNKLITNISGKESPHPLIIYEYRLNIKPNKHNKSLNDFLLKLKTQKELSGLLPYEHPVSCHYLLYRNQLVLFTFSGLLDWYEDFDTDVLMEDLYPRPR